MSWHSNTNHTNRNTSVAEETRKLIDSASRGDEQSADSSGHGMRQGYLIRVQANSWCVNINATKNIEASFKTSFWPIVKEGETLSTSFSRSWPFAISAWQIIYVKVYRGPPIGTYVLYIFYLSKLHLSDDKFEMRQKVTQLKIWSDCLIYWIGMSFFVLVLMNKRRKLLSNFLQN